MLRTDFRAALVACVLLGGCTGPAPSTASAPPDVEAPPRSDAELSRFSVPLRYDFSAMLRVVEHAVPTTFGSIDSIRMIGTDDRRHYAFEAHRGPFTAFGRGGRVHLRAIVAYRARGFYKPPLGPTLSAGCGGERPSERPRLAIELSAPLTLTADYHLASTARIVRVEPVSDAPRDHCDVTLLNRDMTPRVVESARSALQAHLAEIDRKVGEVSLRDQVSEWWALLARPIQLSDDVWLLLGPERLRMGAMGGRDQVLEVPISLDARPRIVTGRTQPAVPVPPLPPLAHGDVTDGFHITMDGLIDYGTASRALEAALVGHRFDGPTGKVFVRRIAAAPTTKGRLAITIAFSGYARGTIRLVGTPVYDVRTRMLALPDLDYDLEADSRLINSLAWLRSDALRSTFRKQARFPVAPALARGRSLLLEGLNRKLGDAATLSATVDSVAVRGLSVTRDGLLVRAEAKGHARMAVRQQ
ncbi:MAG TPA: DUF4403 family protein [Gemmatimonadaceae bacterium]